MDTSLISSLNERFSNAPVSKIIDFVCDEFRNKIALASSLGAEDQVITHLISELPNKASVFTLDTGRMFPETYSLIAKTEIQYNMKIKLYYPDTEEVEQMVSANGINLFYESIEKRKFCCHVRKINPLKRAFEGLDAWICGLRREQSVTRANVQMFEWDDVNNILKINPLIEWSEEEVWAFIRKNGVPYNVLHDKGFPSIGCQPCTRAIKPGEDVRAGRWWWENPDQKECGLHVKE